MANLPRTVGGKVLHLFLVSLRFEVYQAGGDSFLCFFSLETIHCLRCVFLLFLFLLFSIILLFLFLFFGKKIRQPRLLPWHIPASQFYFLFALSLFSPSWRLRNIVNKVQSICGELEHQQKGNTTFANMRCRCRWLFRLIGWEQALNSADDCEFWIAN